ncbi:PREDICTED: phosphatidate phosphatase PAH1 [Tarenaya hassleriana]|uniref:phosphatidate phosphatase PAH1 n=1 Tax=Tarenaya hassleriana TaxID=28532 RepID=UPI00053C0C3B|nr:PREDICTED: phosphatidate phosphatase PAH1 [Tarenaya hassleriana]
MNVVGKVGSLISQGVYSVATPFHPFGGAIDVIVVQQQDGSFRSTPWYVRFGKFQGVLKVAEKIVKISVNGIEAGFHMYLDNSGEAYFIREVDSGKESGSNGVLKGNNGNGNNHEPYRLEHSVSDSGVEQLREGFESLNHLERTESDGNRRYYDFQDEQSPPMSEYGSARYENLNVENYGESQGSDSEVVLVSVDGHILTAPVSTAELEAENLRLDTPQFHLAPGDGTEFCEGNTEFASSETPWTTTDYIGKVEASDANVEFDNAFDPRLPTDSEKVSHDSEREDVFRSCLELTELAQHGQNLKCEELPPPSVAENDKTADGVIVERRDDFGLLPANCSDSSFSHITTEHLHGDEELMISNDPNTDSECKDEQPGTSAATVSVVDFEEGEIMESEHQGSGRFSTESTGKDDERLISCEMTGEDAGSVVEHGEEKILDSPAATSGEETQPHARQRFEISLCKDELHQGMGLSAAARVFDAHRISLDEYKHSAVSILESENLVVRIGDMYLPWKKASPIVLGKAVFDLDIEIQPDDVISVEEIELTKSKDGESTNASSSSSGRRWRLWPIPFRRVKTIEHTDSNSSSEELFVDSEPDISASDSHHESPRKQLVRTNVPTSEQIASLNLKDGQNMITFSFSTRVLGTQQVDAHIYLWKWDAKIVISDVDGTITKSDVLGQFMPLVGKDWTQSGVAKLFSAIKENGYQLLFLSARAIVQAYLTRSFLVNLKQDGKALPNGPVVISPDGLFPALYREVIRRAPHEFKIACLEDIRKLFPTDYNPFYAGFGNRDTDELSYRKLGIPKGKVFIINPKGEVATGHRIDVKSYTSLHTLVNDMFPPTSLVEQEDYNSWNFWKTPLEEVD